MNKLAGAVLLCFAGMAGAGDSTTTTAAPAIAANVVTPMSACTRPTEEAVTNTGRLVRCEGGTWSYQGVTDIERVFVSEKIVPADIGTYKSLAANCPSGKRVLDGGCALLSGTNGAEGQFLVVDSMQTNMTGWMCAYGVLNSNAIKQYYFFGWSDAGISAEAYCGRY